MRRLQILFAVAVAACSKQPASSTTTATSAPPSAATVASAPVVDAGPPPVAESVPAEPPSESTAVGPVKPKLTLDVSSMGPGEWKATAEGLPAISEDGAHVALFWPKEDGARGYPSHGLLLLGAADAKVEKDQVILVADEINKAESAKGASDTTLPAYKKKAAERLEEANKLLDKSTWQKLPWQAVPPSALNAGGTLPALKAAGFEGKLAAGKLIISDPAGKVALEKDTKAFQVKGSAGQPGAGPCKLEPYLKLLAADKDKRVVVTSIGQLAISGGDTCFGVTKTVVYRLKP